MSKILPLGNVLGMLLMLFSSTYLLPIATALIYRDRTEMDFIYAMALTLASGYVLWASTRSRGQELKPRDGFLLVLLAWLLMAGAATLPLMLVIEELSFTDAFFEAMSGLTTTGSTVLSGLDRLPPAINLWRHELNWLGGMGIIVLAVAILPLLGVGGMQLYKAETPGPMKDTKLTPRITETAKSLWYVYVGITAACLVALKLAGMSWLDAICHAFSAMSLGGFSTHDASIGYFDSPVIEFILIVFMLIAGINFATHFLAWRGKSLKGYGRDVEGLAFLSLVLISALGVAAFLHVAGAYDNFWTALRYAGFNVVSIATTCGFMSVDYDHWPIFAPLWMLFLSCISVSSGSTGGGIKMVRTMVLYKQSLREMVKLLHPSVVSPLKIGGHVVPNEVAYSVLGFIFLYFMSIVILTFALLVSGLDFISAFSAAIASINNAGPGLNKVGPASNYGLLTDFQTWVCSFAMLLGRLEVMTLLIVFTPQFWRK